MLPLVAACALAFGCSHLVPVNPEYVAEAVDEIPALYPTDRPIVLVIPESRAVETREQRPSSVTGFAAAWTIPTGRFLSEVSQAYFSRISGSPVQVVPQRSEQANPAVYTLEPSITGFDWELDQARNVGFAITPQAQVSLAVGTSDAESGIQGRCDSAWVDGPSYAMATLGGVRNRVSEAIIRAFVQCLDQVGRTIPKRSESSAPATTGGAHPPEEADQAMPAPPENGDPHKRLLELHDLRQRGIITEDEYQEKRKGYLEAL